MNSKEEIVAAHNHMAAAYLKLIDALTILNLAADVWNDIPPAKQRLRSRQMARSHAEIVHEIQAARRILLK